MVFVLYYININLRWFIDLKMVVKFMRFLERKVVGYFFDLWVVKNFLVRIWLKRVIN